MAELTDEEVIDAMKGAGRRMTYVVANILRMTHKHHNGTLGTAKVLRRLKALEKLGVVERVRSDYDTLGGGDPEICRRCNALLSTAHSRKRAANAVLSRAADSADKSD